MPAADISPGTFFGHSRCFRFLARFSAALISFTSELTELFWVWCCFSRRGGWLSSRFILGNSAAGLLGQLRHDNWQTLNTVPHGIVWWAPAALIGGIAGSELGSRRLTPLVMRRLLAAVLVVAGAKMLLTK